MNNFRRVLYLIIVVTINFDLIASSAANCPVEADPATILSCVAIDAVGLVQVTKGNIRVFCTMAERFMECVKTKTRGCIGEEFVRGSLSELIELSQKCCVNRDEKMSDECPFVHRPRCFSLNDTIRTPYGQEISMRNVQVGDKVMAIDGKERIISTEVIAILHYETEPQAMFYKFKTESGHEISLTPEHLIYIGNQTFIQARDVDKKEHSLFVQDGDGQLKETRIKSVEIQLQHGYVTPVTEHGTLLVNNITSSCYASIYHHSLGHAAMAPLRWIHKIKQIFGLNKNKQMHDVGLHWYPRALNNFVYSFLPFSDRLISTPANI